MKHKRIDNFDENATRVSYCEIVNDKASFLNSLENLISHQSLISFSIVKPAFTRKSGKITLKIQKLLRNSLSRPWLMGR